MLLEEGLRADHCHLSLIQRTDVLLESRSSVADMDTGLHSTWGRLSWRNLRHKQTGLEDFKQQGLACSGTPEDSQREDNSLVAFECRVLMMQNERGFWVLFLGRLIQFK